MSVSVGTRSSERRTSKALHTWLWVSEPLWLSGKQSISVLVRLMEGALGLVLYCCILSIISESFSPQ